MSEIEIPMKCLRCGYCCKSMAVIIINNPEKGITEDNLIIHDGDGVSPCKHLKGDAPGDYSCAIHDYDWYKDTPCFSHTQIEESEDTPCRMGTYILKNRSIDV